MLKTDEEMLAEWEKWEDPELSKIVDEMTPDFGAEPDIQPTQTIKQPINPVRIMDEQYLNQEQEKSNQFFANHVLNNPAATRAVRGYTNDGKDNQKDIGHTSINLAQLGEKPTTKAIENRVKALEKLADEYGLDKDITVYRGLSVDYVADWEVGGTYSPKMFTSTTANIYTSKQFAEQKPHPMFMEIRVAKGTKGFYIGENTFYEKGGKHENEWEFLLGNKVKYTVISKEQKGVYEYWVVEARNE